MNDNHHDVGVSRKRKRPWEGRRSLQNEAPSNAPSGSSTELLCQLIPTACPSSPSTVPSFHPSKLPSVYPSITVPSVYPSIMFPSIDPSIMFPSIDPSQIPSIIYPSQIPSVFPSLLPSATEPSITPSIILPSNMPSDTMIPSGIPSDTMMPSGMPSDTMMPSSVPSMMPSWSMMPSTSFPSVSLPPSTHSVPSAFPTIDINARSCPVNDNDDDLAQTTVSFAYTVQVTSVAATFLFAVEQQLLDLVAMDLLWCKQPQPLPQRLLVNRKRVRKKPRQNVPQTMPNFNVFHLMRVEYPAIPSMIATCTPSDAGARSCWTAESRIIVTYNATLFAESEAHTGTLEVIRDAFGDDAPVTNAIHNRVSVLFLTDVPGAPTASPDEPRRPNHTPLVVLVTLFVLLGIGVGVYFCYTKYRQHKGDQEEFPPSEIHTTGQIQVSEELSSEERPLSDSDTEVPMEMHPSSSGNFSDVFRNIVANLGNRPEKEEAEKDTPNTDPVSLGPPTTAPRFYSTNHDNKDVASTDSDDVTDPYSDELTPGIHHVQMPQYQPDRVDPPGERHPNASSYHSTPHPETVEHDVHSSNGSVETYTDETPSQATRSDGSDFDESEYDDDPDFHDDDSDFQDDDSEFQDDDSFSDTEDDKFMVDDEKFSHPHHLHNVDDDTEDADASVAVQSMAYSLSSSETADPDSVHTRKASNTTSDLDSVHTRKASNTTSHALARQRQRLSTVDERDSVLAETVHSSSSESGSTYPGEISDESFQQDENDKHLDDYVRVDIYGGANQRGRSDAPPPDAPVRSSRLPADSEEEQTRQRRQIRRFKELSPVRTMNESLHGPPKRSGSSVDQHRTNANKGDEQKTATRPGDKIVDNNVEKSNANFLEALVDDDDDNDDDDSEIPRKPSSEPRPQSHRPPPSPIAPKRKPERTTRVDDAALPPLKKKDEPPPLSPKTLPSPKQPLNNKPTEQAAIAKQQEDKQRSGESTASLEVLGDTKPAAKPKGDDFGQGSQEDAKPETVAEPAIVPEKVADTEASTEETTTAAGRPLMESVDTGELNRRMQELSSLPTRARLASTPPERRGSVETWNSETWNYERRSSMGGRPPLRDSMHSMRSMRSTGSASSLVSLSESQSRPLTGPKPPRKQRGRSPIQALVPSSRASSVESTDNNNKTIQPPVSPSTQPSGGLAYWQQAELHPTTMLRMQSDGDDSVSDVSNVQSDNDSQKDDHPMVLEPDKPTSPLS